MVTDWTVKPGPRAAVSMLSSTAGSISRVAPQQSQIRKAAAWLSAPSLAEWRQAT